MKNIVLILISRASQWTRVKEFSVLKWTNDRFVTESDEQNKKSMLIVASALSTFKAETGYGTIMNAEEADKPVLLMPCRDHVEMPRTQSTNSP